MFKIPLPVLNLISSIEYIINVFIVIVYLNDCSTIMLILMWIGHLLQIKDLIAKSPVVMLRFIIALNIIVILIHIVYDSSDYGIIADFFGKSSKINKFHILSFDLIIFILQIYRFHLIYTFSSLAIYKHIPATVREVLEDINSILNSELDYILIEPPKTDIGDNDNNNEKDNDYVFSENEENSFEINVINNNSYSTNSNDSRNIEDEQAKKSGNKSIFKRLFGKKENYEELKDEYDEESCLIDKNEHQEDNTNDNNSLNNSIYNHIYSNDNTNTDNNNNNNNNNFNINEKFDNTNLPTTSAITTTPLTNKINNSDDKKSNNHHQNTEISNMEKSNKDEDISFTENINIIINEKNKVEDNKRKEKEKEKEKGKGKEKLNEEEKEEEEEESDDYFDSYEDFYDKINNVDYISSSSNHKQSSLFLSSDSDIDSDSNSNSNSDITHHSDEEEFEEIDEMEEITESNENAILYLESYYQFLPIIHVSFSSVWNLISLIRRANKKN